MKKSIANLLKTLEKTRGNYWNISKDLGNFLNILINTRQFKNVLEIGTSNGYSGIWMAEALSKTGGHLWTIESHKKERFLLGFNNFKKAGLLNWITHLSGHAPEAIPLSPKFFDMVFLDATKMEYIQYFNVIKNRVKKNGLIVADNINSHKKALAAYVKAVRSNKNWHSEKLEIGSGVLLSLKIH